VIAERALEQGSAPQDLDIEAGRANSIGDVEAVHSQMIGLAPATFAFFGRDDGGVLVGRRLEVQGNLDDEKAAWPKDARKLGKRLAIVGDVFENMTANGGAKLVIFERHLRDVLLRSHVGSSEIGGHVSITEHGTDASPQAGFGREMQNGRSFTKQLAPISQQEKQDSASRRRRAPWAASRGPSPHPSPKTALTQGAAHSIAGVERATSRVSQALHRLASNGTGLPDLEHDCRRLASCIQRINRAGRRSAAVPGLACGHPEHGVQVVVVPFRRVL